MTQRFQKGSNATNDRLVCERYWARFLNKDKQGVTPLAHLTRERDKTVKTILPNNQNQLRKSRPNKKQQNFHSPNRHIIQNKQHSDDSSLLDVKTLKTMNSRQRSKSTTVDREPWSQLLKQQRSGDKISMFGNFDPLRTLHFLARELQFQLQSVLPDDSNIQQMVSDMQYALKRVPPEVASSVHLQQVIDAMPRKSSSKCNLDKAEKLMVTTNECGVQTIPMKSFEDNYELQQIMEENTLKLEKSCKHMEKLCTDLKNEKNQLEKELAESKHSNKILKTKISDLELENNEILSPRVKVLEEEKRKLESQMRMIANKLETVSQHSFNDLKSQISELKSQKNAVEQECKNMKHHLKVLALEREKFVAVLTLRDAQIKEIRNDMKQLQDIVNDQLMQVHKHQNVSNFENCEQPEKNDQGGDGMTSTLDEPGYYTPKQTISFKDLQSGDIDVSNFFNDDTEKHQKHLKPPVKSLNSNGLD